MQGHEVALLRRSLAHPGATADPGEVVRALATLEALFHERAEIRWRLQLMETAPCSRVKALAGELRALLGER
jgi:hypothetical protein